MVVKNFDFSTLLKYRVEFIKNYKSIFKIPVVYSRYEIPLSYIKDGHKVLDIGAGDRRFEKILLNNSKRVTYVSMDKDKTLFHDYYSIGEIKGKFDVIVMFEVIEHMRLSEFITTLKKIKRLLVNDGLLIVSTPNIFCPHTHFSDIDHIQLYSINDLYAIFRIYGFQPIKIFRVYFKPKKDKLYLLRVIKSCVREHLLKLIDLDYCPCILVIVKK